VKCWGWNAAGQLGYGTTTDRSTPIDAGQPTDRRSNFGRSLVVGSIAAGGRHTCAVTIEGDIWCWGRNEEGQLGAGRMANRGAPGYVRGLGGQAGTVSSRGTSRAR
jgi:alpha-tubulin suppressor-like RCC1 family protein